MSRCNKNIFGLNLRRRWLSGLDGNSTCGIPGTHARGRRQGLPLKGLRTQPNRANTTAKILLEGNPIKKLKSLKAPAKSVASPPNRHVPLPAAEAPTRLRRYVSDGFVLDKVAGFGEAMIISLAKAHGNEAGRFSGKASDIQGERRLHAGALPWRNAGWNEIEGCALRASRARPRRGGRSYTTTSAPTVKENGFTGWDDIDKNFIAAQRDEIHKLLESTLVQNTAIELTKVRKRSEKYPVASHENHENEAALEKELGFQQRRHNLLAANAARPEITIRTQRIFKEYESSADVLARWGEASLALRVLDAKLQVGGILEIVTEGLMVIYRARARVDWEEDQKRKLKQGIIKKIPRKGPRFLSWGDLSRILYAERCRLGHHLGLNMEEILKMERNPFASTQQHLYMDNEGICESHLRLLGILRELEIEDRWLFYRTWKSTRNQAAHPTVSVEDFQDIISEAAKILKMSPGQIEDLKTFTKAARKLMATDDENNDE